MRFREHPDAVAETARLADRLRFDLTTDLGYSYPGAEDGSADRRLAEACRARFGERYDGKPERAEAERRLEQELNLISGLKLSGFFLLHRDLLELAREVAIEVRGPDSARSLLPPGRGRGSSVSSVVCYLTGLSHVDPIKAGLFLGRFLNEEIAEAPDIDLDFPRDVRERLIPRIHERYGADRSALVAAFPTYRVEGGDPRLRQGAGPAARRDRAGGPLGEPLREGGGRGRLGAAAGAAEAARRRLRPPPAPLPAPRRDGALDPAADRSLPGRAGGDGGPADRPVGQGLLRRRRLLEDRPARPRDAVGGRADRDRDRPGPRSSGSTSRGSRSTTPRSTGGSAPPRRPGSSRSRAGRRCRCCPAPGPRTSRT